jgi:hypothetical protein
VIGVPTVARSGARSDTDGASRCTCSVLVGLLEPRTGDPGSGRKTAAISALGAANQESQRTVALSPLAPSLSFSHAGIGTPPLVKVIEPEGVTPGACGVTLADRVTPWLAVTLCREVKTVTELPVAAVATPASGPALRASALAAETKKGIAAIGARAARRPLLLARRERDRPHNIDMECSSSSATICLPPTRLAARADRYRRRAAFGWTWT